MRNIKNAPSHGEGQAQPGTRPDETYANRMPHPIHDITPEMGWAAVRAQSSQGDDDELKGQFQNGLHGRRDLFRIDNRTNSRAGSRGFLANRRQSPNDPIYFFNQLACFIHNRL